MISKSPMTYVGATDFQITNKNDFRQGVKEALIEPLRQAPDVKVAYGRLETDTGLLDAEGKPISGRAAQLIGVDRPTDVDITRSATDEGTWFDTATGDVVVIDQQAAEVLKVKVGGTILLPSADQKRTFKVVGLCHKPAILAEKNSL